MLTQEPHQQLPKETRIFEFQKPLVKYWHSYHTVLDRRTGNPVLRAKANGGGFFSTTPHIKIWQGGEEKKVHKPLWGGANFPSLWHWRGPFLPGRVTMTVHGEGNMLLKKSGLGKARFAADARQFTSVATAGKTYTWRKYTPLLDKDRVLVRDRNGVKQSRSKFLFPSGIMICLDENGGEVAMFDNCWTQLNPRKEGELWIHPGVAEPLQHELLLSALVLVEIERRKAAANSGGLEVGGG